MSKLLNWSNLTIFVVTHKLFKLPIDDDFYLPIQVGIRETLPYLSENQLDNIAHKNRHYCELSVLYFLWKNVDCPTVGLVHYRRYFGLKNPFLVRFSKKMQYVLGLKKEPFTSRYHLLPKNELNDLLKTSDMIVSNAVMLDKSVKENYAEHHHLKDWIVVQDVITQKYPDYLPAFHQVSNGNVFYPYNMFIGKKHIVDQYCQWLFDILFTAESLIDYTEYDSYNQRVFGFLAERLFTVWIVHHYQDFHFSYLPVVQIKNL